MSKREVMVLLDDILVSCQKILKYTKGKSYEEFIKDELLIDAIIRNFEIIGEAVKHVPRGLEKDCRA